MQSSVKRLLGVLILAASLPHTLLAQEREPVFTVSYIEVLPAGIDRVKTLLDHYARSAMAESGNLRFQILERIERPGHFAILEAWSDQRAQDAHAASSATAAFRGGLEPLLYSPYDERPSSPVMGTTGAGNAGDIVVLTHVDFVRSGLEAGLAALETFVTLSRQQPGAIDIGVIIQTSRTNHMTLFEVWSDLASQEGNTVSAHAIRYRAAAQASIGALYDERRYRAL
jgi:quinol monooxygenase YgiN